MSQWTIRVRVDGGDGIGGRRVAVERKLNASGVNADFTFRFIALVRSAKLPVILYQPSLQVHLPLHYISYGTPPHWSAPLRSMYTSRVNAENNGGTRNVALPTTA